MSVPTDTIQSQPNERCLMPKYKVEIKELLIHTGELEADDYDSAFRLANELIESDSEMWHTESDGCFDTDVKEVK